MEIGMRFRKKPVEVDAVQWRGDNYDEVRLFAKNKVQRVNHLLVIDTLEGQMQAQPGDWIIRGVQGEYYPIKPSIFESTYEPVE